MTDLDEVRKFWNEDFLWTGSAVHINGSKFFSEERRLKGRGRESIFLERGKDEIVRLFDGMNYPLAKCYSHTQSVPMLEKNLQVEESDPHFYPARVFPLSVPHWLHQFLEHRLGFMVLVTLHKPCVV